MSPPRIIRQLIEAVEIHGYDTAIAHLIGCQYPFYADDASEEPIEVIHATDFRGLQALKNLQGTDKVLCAARVWGTRYPGARRSGYQVKILGYPVAQFPKDVNSVPCDNARWVGLWDLTHLDPAGPWSDIRQEYDVFLDSLADSMPNRLRSHIDSMGIESNQYSHRISSITQWATHGAEPFKSQVKAWLDSVAAEGDIFIGNIRQKYKNDVADAIARIAVLPYDPDEYDEVLITRFNIVDVKKVGSSRNINQHKNHFQ